MRILAGTAVLAVGLVIACAKTAPEAQRTATRDSLRETPPPRNRPTLARGSGQCGDIIGYLNDPAPGGRTVYAAADTQSSVRGRILPPWVDEYRPWPASFAIHEARDGWLLVEHAGDDSVLTERPARPMYSGRGWIRGNGVSVGVQASQAFAEPRHASDLVVQADPVHTLEGVGAITEVVACEGDWVRARWTIHAPQSVRYDVSALVSRDPLVVEGWATGICNIQETSCDMQPGDRPDSVKPDAGR